MEPSYEIWFTPNPNTLIGITLIAGVVRVYEQLSKTEDSTWNLLFTLPPQHGPVILDDFTRAEEGPPPSESWSRVRE